MADRKDAAYIEGWNAAMDHAARVADSLAASAQLKQINQANSLARLLAEPGVISVKIGPLEADGSVSIDIEWLLAVGTGDFTMHHLTAADSIDGIAERIAEIVDNDEIDPR